MVLQDITGPPNDSLADDPHPSDNDPYSNPLPSADTLDLSNLPRPIPIIGPFIGYTNGRVQAGVKQAMGEAEKVLQRPMTYEEATALSYVWAKKSSIASYGTALGVAFAGYQSYRTRATFRYPFWTPNPEKFNPNEFFAIRGQSARTLFHVTRIIPYLILGRFVGSLFGESWGTAYAITQSRADARLKEFHEAMVKRASQGRTGSPSPGVAGQSTPDGRPIPQQTSPARTSWPQRDPRPVPGTRTRASDDDDDMSPAAGNEAWSDSFDRAPDLNSTSKSDTPASDTSYGKGTYDRQARTSERNVPHDGSSPASGAFPGEEEKENPSTGSAWDRIRRSSAGQTPTSPTTNRSFQEGQQEGFTPRDSFSFSNTDEDRQLAKAEAQREFDARVERERRGDDFEDRGKRW